MIMTHNIDALITRELNPKASDFPTFRVNLGRLGNIGIPDGFIESKKIWKFQTTISTKAKMIASEYMKGLNKINMTNEIV